VRGRQLHYSNEALLLHIADFCGVRSCMFSLCMSWPGDGKDPDASNKKSLTYIRDQLKLLADLISKGDVSAIGWRLPASGLACDEVTTRCSSHLDFPWRAEGDFEAGGKSEVQLYLAFSR